MSGAGKAGFLFSALLCCVSCRSGSGAGSRSSSSSPDQVITQFVLDSFDKGQRAWTLRSPRALVYDADDRVELDAPRMRFFDRGRPGAEMEAGKGRLFPGRRDLVAWDGVVMVSTEGATLKSDWMEYSGALDLVTSTAPVTVTRGGSVVRGTGWEAKPDLSKIVVRRQTVEWTGDAPVRRKKPDEK